MSLSLMMYHDAALTQPVTVESIAVLSQLVGGGSVDRQLWLGSAVPGRVFRDLADPGVGQILIEVADADDAAGQPASSVRLAYTQAGLATATPGAALAVSVEILSGVGNAVPFWLRWTPVGAVAGVFTDCVLQTTEVEEVSAGE